MSAVQLSAAGTQRGNRGAASLTVTDPNNEVRTVAFVVVDNTSVRSDPLPTHRVPSAGTYEHDVGLLRNSFVRVEPQVELTDGSILRSDALMFGARSEPRNAVPGTLASLTLTTQSRTLEVSAPPDTAVAVDSYARRGSWPTLDALATGVPADEYLRFLGDATQPSFTTAAEPGTWYVIAAGYNAAGQRGPVKSALAEVPA